MPLAGLNNKTPKTWPSAQQENIMAFCRDNRILFEQYMDMTWEQILNQYTADEIFFHLLQAELLHVPQQLDEPEYDLFEGLWEDRE